MRARGAGALGVEQRVDRLLVLLDGALVLGTAAEPGDGLGDAQGMAGADRLAQGEVAQHGRGHGVGAGAQAVEAAGVLLEGQRGELVERGRVELRRGEGEDQEAVLQLRRRRARGRRGRAARPGPARSTSAPTVAATSSQVRSAACSGSARSAAAAGVAASRPASLAAKATSTGAS